MTLGSWGRFLIMVSGASFVVVAVLVVACFVGPGCWGFEYLRKEEKKKKLKNLGKLQTKNGADPRSKYDWLENNDYVIYERSPRGFETEVIKISETPMYRSKESIFNLRCAPLLVAPHLFLSSKTSAPKLEVKLFFCNLGENEDEGRLTVQIISAAFLPGREYIGSLDPFVTLEILNNKWSLQKSERIVHTVHTNVVKNNLNPTFDETFVFSVKKGEMKNWCLKFTISDDDHLTKITSIFERRLHLKELKDFTVRDHIPLNLDMQEVVKSVGTLLFGISYLPTAQRLNISVVKATKLKYQGVVQSLADFYPYVRIVMVNNHGKCIKKKKTFVRPKDQNPIFSHSLMFDVSISNLEQTVFLVLLCNKVVNQSTSDDSSQDGDIETCLKECKDKVLGTVVLGRNVRCTRARDHWVTVMQNPRKTIFLWHDLR